jgi:hypothetical protein
VHHIVVAFRQTQLIGGTTLGLYFQLSDGATNQCCVVFRSDGAILLTSATPGGTVLDTYTGAVTAPNTWYAFEFEIVINNTTGSWAVRKNGNASNDQSRGSLNTRPGTTAQANKLTMGMSVVVIAHQFDDVLWQSGASSGTWLGDVRCYARMPASDASAQFSRSPTPMQVTPWVPGTTAAITAANARYAQFTASYTGTVGSVSVTLSTGYTGNMKCAMFAQVSTSTNQPGVLLGTATAITNPVAGVNTFTFPTPVSVVSGTIYWLGFIPDTTSGTWNVTSTNVGFVGTGLTYAAFPASTPVIGATQPSPIITAFITTAGNFNYVNEPQQDGASTYVYDSTVGHADFYNFGTLGATPPSSIVALTTRGFMEKGDAGARGGAMQIKSGATTVASPTLSLATNFQWTFRTDTLNPNTGTAWTTATADAATIGPTVVS